VLLAIGRRVLAPQEPQQVLLELQFLLQFLVARGDFRLASSFSICAPSSLRMSLTRARFSRVSASRCSVSLRRSL
jgi:hypothetical protein